MQILSQTTRLRQTIRMRLKRRLAPSGSTAATAAPAVPSGAAEPVVPTDAAEPVVPTGAVEPAVPTGAAEPAVPTGVVVPQGVVVPPQSPEAASCGDGVPTGRQPSAEITVSVFCGDALARSARRLDEHIGDVSGPGPAVLPTGAVEPAVLPTGAVGPAVPTGAAVPAVRAALARNGAGARRSW